MQLVSDLVESVMPLADGDDAVDAEMAGAMLMATMLGSAEEAATAFTQVLIPQVEAASGRGALAFLLALGAVAQGTQQEVAEAASAAAARLARAGVPEPRWAAELAAPVQVDGCVRLSDPHGAVSVLAASFRRTGPGDAFLVVVDEQDCGAAQEISGAEAGELPAVLDVVREGARADGLDLRAEHLDPAEWRWYVEQALDARADHDAEDPDGEWPGPIDDDPEDGPPYHVLAMLVRTRLAGLPAARRPAGARAGHDETEDGPLLTFTAPAALPARARRAGSGAIGLPALPPKRDKSAGPAPIYQVKVTLKGMRPPIWRRLLVPADESLDRLHDVIQAAFGWDDSHLHVFETPYGSFGRADRELGHGAGSRVTLEQVAPQAKDKITYLYDFGDSWAHEILLEKVVDREPGMTYPYCSGGRRAAPPEDCGGVWGYGAMLEVLADPRHPEHEDRLEWLGLEDASDFDPGAFDVDAVNRVLAPRRRR